jgi:hypothetical protein
MSNAEVYNAARLSDGTIAAPEVTQLTRHYQADNGLLVDGMLGPQTRKHLMGGLVPGVAIAHAPMLPSVTHGKPVVTSGHWTVNRSRAPSAAYHGHQGIDIMYRLNKTIGHQYIDGMKHMRRTDGTFCVEGNTRAYAVDDCTVVDVADRANGFAVCIARTAGDVFVYRHLQDVAVPKGAKIVAGTIIGEVGHTTETSLVHLHFEWHASVDALRSRYRESLNPGPLCSAHGIVDAWTGK